MIVLAGAELAFSIQNIAEFEYENSFNTISPRQKETLLLAMLSLIIKDFYFEKPLISTTDISRKFKIPIRLTRQLMYDLTSANLITEIKNRETDKAECYQPAHSTDKITIYFAINAIDNACEEPLFLENHEKLQDIDGLLKKFSSSIKKSKHNILLKDI